MWGAQRLPPAAPTVDATIAPPVLVAKKPLTPVATAAEPPASPIADPTPAAMAGAASPPSQTSEGLRSNQAQAETSMSYVSWMLGTLKPMLVVYHMPVSS